MNIQITSTVDVDVEIMTMMKGHVEVLTFRFHIQRPSHT